MKGETELHYALALQMNGDKKGAINYLNRIIKEKPFINANRLTRLWAGKAFVHLIDAQFQDAFTCGQKICHLGLNNDLVYSETLGIYLKALIHFYRNEWNEAEIRLRELLAKKYQVHVRVTVDAFCMFVHIHCLNGENETAISF